MGIAEEEAELAREMRQFVKEDVPELLVRVQHQLENAERRWVRMEAQEEEMGKAMKAKVKIDGHIVADAEIEVNLRRGHLVNAKLEKPCVMDQLIEFHRMLQAQYRHIEHVVQALDKQVALVEDANLSVWVALVEFVVEELNRSCQALRKGGNAVRLPSNRRFPYCTQLDHQFQPPLPSDMLIDFSVHQARLVIEAFVVSASTKPIDEVLSAANKKEFAGQVTVFRGQTIEIVKQTSVTLALPGLDDMLAVLDIQVASLLHARDQAEALLQCQTVI
ncbi:hypothetical protein AC1031_002082 [Aphanomyces cochlioides]|nr:hypothetical protein AC1031_002082 [Aphanomyces cochlioides]